MLISPEYLDLNRDLHAKGRYGLSGARWAGKVRRLMEEKECETALDYGCGQGLLKKALGEPEWLAEYDPAISGKDGTPARADLVVCCDVLEHVEPECMDAVLGELRKKIKKVGFFNIATRPAVKTLADGRNAHLSVHDAGWWEEQLSPYFQITDFDVTEDDLTVTVLKQNKIGDLKTKSAVSKTLRREQMAVNIPRVKGRVFPQPPLRRTVVLACYGPSLTETWKDIADAKKMGAFVATVSGAHDYLIERGVIPDAHLEVDPREHKCHYTRNPHKDVMYAVASCVHPKMIDQLQDQQLFLWHVATDEGSIETVRELDPGNVLIGGGGSIGLRAMNVLYALGFRRFLIHGMDCSFSEAGDQHAGEHKGKRMSVSPVRCGDRWFNSSLALCSYARSFFNDVRRMNDQAKTDGEDPIAGDEYICVDLAGDGLLQEMAREQLT